MTGELHVVVPEHWDDPARVSGGNIYDTRVCEHLVTIGWQVRIHVVTDGVGPVEPNRSGLEATLRRLPAGALVLLDGLVACAEPAAFTAEAARLRLVVLVHMPYAAGEADVSAMGGEGVVLCSAAAVVTTSRWSRHQLLTDYALAPEAVHVAQPGTDPAPVAASSEGGASLLCVAAVAPHKGQDVLVRALAGLGQPQWRCLLVGPLDRDRTYVAQLRELVRDFDLEDRVTFLDTRVGPDLDASYGAADLVVVPSRFESYGMVIGEALARGIPVIATTVGGLPEALGRTSEGQLPGMLIAPDDEALRAALTEWLASPTLRESLRAAAGVRRRELPGWNATAQRLSAVLADVVRGTAG